MLSRCRTNHLETPSDVVRYCWVQAKRALKQGTKQIAKLVPRFGTSFRALAASLLCADREQRATAAAVCGASWFGKLVHTAPDAEVCTSKIGRLSKR